MHDRIHNLSPRKPFRETERIREYVVEAVRVLTRECPGLKTDQIQQFIFARYGKSFSRRELGAALQVLTKRKLLRGVKGAGGRYTWYLEREPQLSEKYDKVWVSLSSDLGDQLSRISKVIKVPKSYILERALASGLKDYLMVLLKEHSDK